MDIVKLGVMAASLNILIDRLANAHKKYLIQGAFRLDMLVVTLSILMSS